VGAPGGGGDARIPAEQWQPPFGKLEVEISAERRKKVPAS